MQQVEKAERMEAKRWGATIDEWRYLANAGDLICNVLPIISNKGLLPAPAKDKKDIRGKAPSVKGFNGAYYMQGWTTHRTTREELSAWANDSDYGYGYRTGEDGVIAIDCDCEDANISQYVRAKLAEITGLTIDKIAVRTRGNARWATLIQLPELAGQSIPKVVIKIDDNNSIEFRGSGHQLAMCGTHPSGVRYSWSRSPFPLVQLSSDGLNHLKMDIVETYPCQLMKEKLSERVKGKTFQADDRLGTWLSDNGYVLDQGSEGELYITCPWVDEHTGGAEGSNVKDTVYFPIGSYGYEQGGFKCLHAHCANRTVGDLLKWAKSKGYTETNAEQYPDETENAKATESKKRVDPTIAGGMSRVSSNSSNKRKALSLTDLKDIINIDTNLTGLAFNELSGKVEITTPVPWHTSGIDWRDVDDDHLHDYIRDKYDTPFKDVDLIRAFNIVTDNRSFHPIRDYINALPEWDKVERADRLFVTFLGAGDNIYTREATRKALCAAIKRVFEPGCKFDTAIILEGEQGLGKSTLLRALGRDNWFSDSLSLSSMQDKTAAEAIQGKWIIEIGEFAKGRYYEVESVKAFISRQDDEYRAAYGRRVTSHKRACVFFGTTNSDSGYLNDITGNRRFLPIRVGVNDVEISPFDITDDYVDQVWAEALYRLKQGESLLLGEEASKLALKAQQGALESGELDGVIADYLGMLIPADWDNLGSYERQIALTADDKTGYVKREHVCVLEIWCEALGKNKADIDRKESNKITAALIKLGWTKNSNGEKSLKRTKMYGVQRMLFKS